MKSIIKSIFFVFQIFGLDLIKLFNSIKGIPRFIKNYFLFIKNSQNHSNDFPLKSLYPIFTDWFDSAGSVDSQYFLQDLYVAQLIYKKNPKKHLDVGSRVDGFISNIASFRKIEVMDIRDLNKKIKNIYFKRGDLMKLQSNLINSFDSVSSLHAIEHFGLGRYGDKIDFNGHVKGINNIFKILKNGGIFYLSLPIGPQRIEFNAHRVFSISYLINLLSDKFKILSFSYINDKNVLFEDCELNEQNISENFGCIYGCGIFVLKKNN